MDNYDTGDHSGRHRHNEPQRFVSFVEQLHRQIQQRRSEAHHEQPHEAPLVGVTRKLVRVTWALVFVGICTFGAALLQWDAMREQLSGMQKSSTDTHTFAKAAKEQAAAAKSSAETAAKALFGLERPYVFLEDPTIADYGIFVFPTISGVFKNYGRSPAILREYIWRNTKEETGPNFRPNFNMVMSSAVNQIVSPNGGVSERIKFPSATPWQRSTSLSVHGMLFGKIVYDDIFGNTYTQPFMFVYSPTEEIGSKFFINICSAFVFCHGSVKPAGHNNSGDKK